MEIVRCTKSFRSASRGADVGDLFPASHELVKRFPSMFEPVGDFVTRRFPEHASAPSKGAPADPEKKAPAAPRRSSSGKK